MLGSGTWSTLTATALAPIAATIDVITIAIRVVTCSSPGLFVLVCAKQAGRLTKHSDPRRGENVNTIASFLRTRAMARLTGFL